MSQFRAPHRIPNVSRVRSRPTTNTSLLKPPAATSSWCFPNTKQSGSAPTAFCIACNHHHVYTLTLLILAYSRLLHPQPGLVVHSSHMHTTCLQQYFQKACPPPDTATSFGYTPATWYNTFVATRAHSSPKHHHNIHQQHEWYGYDADSNPDTYKAAL